MRRELPVLWKYLMVVAASCALAFLIAQNDAIAQAPAKSYVSAGAWTVEGSEATWRDDVRKRNVPVKIYSPGADRRNVVAKVSGSALTRAPASAPDARFPVILFSHGLGGNRAGGKLWAEHWASHGYVVVAMQHAGSDEALWKDRPPADLKKNMKSGMTLGNLGLRVSDVRFVIDEVVRRAGIGEKQFAYADTARLGMSGHSFGAHTTLAVAGQKAGVLGGQSGLDTRIVSAIAFSPNARNKRNVARQFGDIQIPFMSITGTRDGSILDDGTRYQDRMLPYENMPAGGKYLVVFDGGDHMVFGGHELGMRRPETSRDREIQSAVKAATVAFWNVTLKRDESARKWLDSAENSASLKFMLNENDFLASK